MIARLPEEEVAHFLRDSIAERRLSDLMRSLNEAVATGDPGLRASAEKALKHLGFL
ncbi:hypothetical protein [Histidinibacterium lentulum]|nr:hypothetical protein [Histidinibacterium lentulum]